MLAVAVMLLLQGEVVPRTPSIFRCSTAEGESARFAEVVKEDYFDTICIDPKPGPKATAAAKAGKLKFIDAKLIDTPANRKWRDATIGLVMGKISPTEWVSRTGKLKATVHFLTNPATPGLREATPSLPIDATYSARSVFAELFLLSQPGRPCFTSSDIGRTRELPVAGKFQSWVLAMNDFLGPLMLMRAEHPALVTGKPKIVRADKKPGLFIYTYEDKNASITFYLNNGPTMLEIPAVNVNYVTISPGLDLEGPKPRLRGGGIVVEVSEPAAVDGLSKL